MFVEPSVTSSPFCLSSVFKRPPSPPPTPGLCRVMDWDGSVLISKAEGKQNDAPRAALNCFTEGEL